MKEDLQKIDDAYKKDKMEIKTKSMEKEAPAQETKITEPVEELTTPETITPKKETLETKIPEVVPDIPILPDEGVPTIEYNDNK